MTTVYLVSDGYYSDYHVLGIYTTRELAEQAQSLFSTENDIVEWELDAVPETPPGLLAWMVYMDQSGNVPGPNRGYIDGGVIHVSAEDFEVRHFRSFNNDNYVCFCVWAKDSSHAIKIANENRLQLLAHEGWVTEQIMSAG